MSHENIRQTPNQSDSLPTDMPVEEQEQTENIDLDEHPGPHEKKTEYVPYSPEYYTGSEVTHRESSDSSKGWF